MLNRIYTQADYDKVTNMYYDYLNRKNSYTPEQQERIESTFWDAWNTMLDRIKQSKNMIADMWWDEQWNTRAQYWDWRKELLNRWNIVPNQSTWQFDMNTNIWWNNVTKQKKTDLPQQQIHWSANNKPQNYNFNFNNSTLWFNWSWSTQTQINSWTNISDYIRKKNQQESYIKRNQWRWTWGISRL